MDSWLPFDAQLSQSAGFGDAQPTYNRDTIHLDNRHARLLRGQVEVVVVIVHTTCRGGRKL